MYQKNLKLTILDMKYERRLIIGILVLTILNSVTSYSDNLTTNLGNFFRIFLIKQ